MHLRQLSLVHFRNYEQQELQLAPGIVLFLGDNAQGKTNLLEAAFLLAAGRSERASGDADFIAWSQRGETQPYARVVGTAARSSGDVSVELTIVGREGARGLVASKRYKLNGIARRSFDVAGNITAVLFTTDDMELVKGAPSDRRRYLDVMLSQVDRAYNRALSRYGKVVTQRNALLKRIREGASRPDELAYWDEQLAAEGSVLLSARAIAVAEVRDYAAEAYARLSGEREQLDIAYEPRFNDRWSPERIASTSADGLASALIDRLASARDRDIGAGMTLLGPHRDDLSLTLGGEAASAFASRGQQRTAALALRLAEARLLLARTGERPLLLLDDVLSELDAGRREHVLDSLDADQVLITSADADRFATVIARAQTYHVAAGSAAPMAEA